MKKEELIELIIIGLITILSFGLGWGMHGEKIKYVSQQKSMCEAKGGKYTLGWNNFSNYYYELCQIPEKEINL